MALPLTGTFEYVVKVPEETGPNSFPWQLELGEEIKLTGDAFHDNRLLGHSPSLWVVDAGFTADSFGLRDVVPVSRFTLRAANQINATSREVFFETDRELTSLFQSGDELRLTHSCMWGTGLTLLRKGKLVVAVGAIGGKLGDGIWVSSPKDALERIMRFENVPWKYRQKKPMLLPLEFSTEEEIISIYAGSAEIADYGIWVQGGTDYSYPSGDTYAAIWRKTICDERHAVASAMMLKVPGMTTIEW